MEEKEKKTTRIHPDDVAMNANPYLLGLSQSIWRQSFDTRADDFVQPFVRDGEIVGDTWPRAAPETDAEMRMGLLQVIHRPLPLETDQDPPGMLEIDENFEITGRIGFDFSPETPEEKRLERENRAAVTSVARKIMRCD